MKVFNIHRLVTFVRSQLLELTMTMISVGTMEIDSKPHYLSFVIFVIFSLTNKYEYKNLFLDALGVEKESERRRLVGGIEYKYTMNSEHPPEEQIDVFLLDERYDRDALPCAVRRENCSSILSAGNDSTFFYHWCDDYLRSGGPASNKYAFLNYCFFIIAFST